MTGHTFSYDLSAPVGLMEGKFFDLTAVADYRLVNRAGDKTVDVTGYLARLQIAVFTTVDDGAGTHTFTVGAGAFETGFNLPSGLTALLDASITRLSALPTVVVPSTPTLVDPAGRRIRGLTSGHTMLWSDFGDGGNDWDSLEIDTDIDGLIVWFGYAAGNIPGSVSANCNARFRVYNTTDNVVTLGYAHIPSLYALDERFYAGAPVSILTGAADVLGFTAGEALVIEDIP